MAGLIKEDYVRFYSDPSEFPTSGNSLNIADGHLKVQGESGSVHLSQQGSQLFVVGEDGERQIVSRDRNVVFAALGDSITAVNCSSRSATSVVRANGTLTITCSNDKIYPGCEFYLGGATQDEFNTTFTALTASATQITAAMAGPDLTATGTITIYQVGAGNSGDWMTGIVGLTNGQVYPDISLGFPTKTSDYVATKAALIAARNTGITHCFELSGVNDIAAGATAEQILARRIVTWDALLAAGITPIVISILPYSASYTATKHYTLLKVNQLIHKYCLENNLIFVDAYSRLVDPLSSQGAYKSGYSSDALHPTVLGYSELATAIYDALVANNIIYGPEFRFTSSAYDVYATNSLSRQLLPNPLNTATAGTVTAPATGTIATGVTGAVVNSPTSVAFSCPARSDGYGNDIQVVTVASSTANNGATLTWAGGLDVGLVDGDFVRFGCEVTVDAGATNLSQIALYVAVSTGGVSYSLALLPQKLTGGTCKIISKKIPVKAGMTFRPTFQVLHSGVGGSTVKFGRFTLIKC